MIRSFADQATADVFRGLNTRAARRVPGDIRRAAQRKLKAVDVAVGLDDLRVPTGNRLEPLRGDRTGRHSIRINDQFRLTFRWKDGHAHDVSIEDYH